MNLDYRLTVGLVQGKPTVAPYMGEGEDHCTFSALFPIGNKLSLVLIQKSIKVCNEFDKIFSSYPWVTPPPRFTKMTFVFLFSFIARVALNLSY